MHKRKKNKKPIEIVKYIRDPGETHGVPDGLVYLVRVYPDESPAQQRLTGVGGLVPGHLGGDQGHNNLGTGVVRCEGKR